MADVDEQLAWERNQAPRGAIAAIVGGLLTLGTGVFTAISYSDIPSPQLLETLAFVAEPGPYGTRESPRLTQFQAFADDFGVGLLAAALTALGALGTALALQFLARATAARRPQFPRIGTPLPIIGGVLIGLGGILLVLGRDAVVDDFLSGPRTVDAQQDLAGGGLFITGQLLGYVGQFALAASFVLISLNAMRTGLLTRFMGILGILVGALLILPLLQGPPVVQAFWLFALAVLFLGRWPRGVPPAWRTGQAEPWPSNAELRAARAGATPAAAGAPTDAADDVRAAHPASKKRKRKRRG